LQCETPVTFCLFENRFVCAVNRIFGMANKAQVASRANVLHGCLLDGYSFQNRSHFQIIGHYHTGVSKTLAQNIRDPFSGKRRWGVAVSHGGIPGM